MLEAELKIAILKIFISLRYQHYGCDAIALWMGHVQNAQCFTIYLQIKFYHTIFVVI